MKIQGWLDWDSVSAPKIPGQVILECETGTCCPLLGSPGSKPPNPDGGEVKDSSAIEESREKAATMFLKFKLRRATPTSGHGGGEKGAD